MVVTYICDRCKAKRIFPQEMQKIVECVECDGFAMLEGTKVLVSHTPDAAYYIKMRTDREKLEKDSKKKKEKKDEE